MTPQVYATLVRPQTIDAIGCEKDDAEEDGARLRDSEHERTEQKGEDIHHLERMRTQRIYDAHEERGDRRHERETEGIRVQGAPIEDNPGKPDEGEGDKRAEAHRRAIREDCGEQKQHPRGKDQACNHIIHGVERESDWTAEHAHDKRAHEMPQCGRSRHPAAERLPVGGCHVLGDLEHGPGAGVYECPNRLHVEGVVVLLRKGIGCTERHDVNVHADGKSQGDVDAERPPAEDAVHSDCSPSLRPRARRMRKGMGADHEHGEEDGHPRAEDAEFGQG